jgi:excisionase family DNA binding protein
MPNFNPGVLKPGRLAYSVADAAAALGVSDQTIYRRIKDGSLKTYKWGGRTLIRPEDLQASLNAALGGAPEGQHHG